MSIIRRLDHVAIMIYHHTLRHLHPPTIVVEVHRSEVLASLLLLVGGVT